jgi:hypothetical protein
MRLSRKGAHRAHMWESEHYGRQIKPDQQGGEKMIIRPGRTTLKRSGSSGMSTMSTLLPLHVSSSHRHPLKTTPVDRDSKSAAYPASA